MHLILKSHVEELATDLETKISDESKLFEIFCNFCTTSKHYFGRFDPAAVTTKEDDASIDGISIVIDGELITTIDDAESAFSSHKTNMQADIIITQAKSGERFSKEEIANFKLGIDDFLTLDPEMPNGELNKRSLDITRTIFKNLKKIKNKKPNIYIYYCTTGNYKEEREIKASFNAIKKSVQSKEFFDKIQVTPLDRSALLKIYNSVTKKSEANLKVNEYMGMPSMPGIPQSYITIVNAKDFVEKLLMDEDGNIKQSVFEENVRSFLGNENEVNKDISSTLDSDDKKKIFPVLNNGVTIVAPDLTLAANTKEIHLSNYQIINGCQTSNTLFEKYENLDESVKLVVKFIESPDSDLQSDIIAATNSQSNIPKESLLGLQNKCKLIQSYFNAQNKKPSVENKIYFERRQCEFKGQGIAATKIFDIKELSRSYAAMFLNIPHTSARYVKHIFTQASESIFKIDDQEAYYYAACLAIYKYQALINGRKIDAQNYNKYRWHIIHMYKWFALNSIDDPKPNSSKSGSAANKIIESLNGEDKKYLAIFKKCQDIIDANPATDDELKRAKYTASLRPLVEKEIKNSNQRKK